MHVFHQISSCPTQSELSSAAAAGLQPAATVMLLYLQQTPIINLHLTAVSMCQCQELLRLLPHSGSLHLTTVTVTVTLE